MLRIEQGFKESVFESENQQLNEYADYHRLLLPALATYDFPISGESPNQVRAKLESVLDGDRRSATLAFVHRNLANAARTAEWLAIRNDLAPDIQTNAPWRVERGVNDGHARYAGGRIWAATRNIVKLPQGVPDEMSTRVRERLTFASIGSFTPDDIRDILATGDAPEDVILATATTYAINKTVPKANTANHPIDRSQFPNVYAAMRRK